MFEYLKSARLPKLCCTYKYLWRCCGSGPNDKVIRTIKEKAAGSCSRWTTMWTTIQRPQIKCVNAFVGILRSVEISCKQKTNCCKILLHLWSLVIRDDDGRSWRTLDSALRPYECSPSSLQPVHQPSATTRPLMHSAEPVDNTCDKRNDLAFSAPSRWQDEIRVRIQKTCWPRCRYRTMVLMMGSSAEQQPEREREREQEEEPDSNGCPNGGGNENRSMWRC